MSALSTLASPRRTATGPRLSQTSSCFSHVCSCSFVVSSAAAERLPIRIYTTEDGLAHANVRRIVRDPRGFLWFCTIDGLSRFDGAEFVTYRTADGLPDPWVTDLLTTRDGTYWVATNGGVARFDPLARHVAPDGQRRAEHALSVFQRRGIRGVGGTTSGSRPAGGSRRSRLGGRSRWALHARQSVSPASFRPVVPSPAAMVTSLVESADGSLWIGTLGGLFHRRPSGDVSAEPMPYALAYARTSAGPGQRWPALGWPRRGIARARTRRWDSQLTSSAAAVAQLWRRPFTSSPIAASNESRRRVHHDRGDGLIDRRVRPSRSDRTGTSASVCRTVGLGLSDVDGAQITSVSPAHGLVDDPINAVTEDRDGNLWIARMPAAP